MSQLIAAIDQGTTSTRCMIFDHRGEVVSVAQNEHQQIYPQPGWVEHDPLEIWERTQQVCRAALAQLPDDYHNRLTAKYCDGATVPQIAEADDSSTEAVRSKLARARRAFRQAFARASSGLPCPQDGQAGAQHEP